MLKTMLRTALISARDWLFQVCECNCAVCQGIAPTKILPTPPPTSRKVITVEILNSNIHRVHYDDGSLKFSSSARDLDDAIGFIRRSVKD